MFCWYSFITVLLNVILLNVVAPWQHIFEFKTVFQVSRFRLKNDHIKPNKDPGPTL
jgi:hypothetical protein